MARIAYLLIVVVVAASLVDATDYCNVKSCKNPREQTLCRFPSPKPAAKCTSYKVASLTPEEKKEILEAHNKFRATVASGDEHRGKPGGQPAGRIPALKWDDELEKIAQRWANQCDFGHSTCSNVDRYMVGQNLAMTMHSGAYTGTMTELVQTWYDEVRKFDANQVSCYEYNPAAGHYTQLVWGDTTSLGCGLIKYRNGDWFITYLVCNYGPAGNWLGQPVYETL